MLTPMLLIGIELVGRREFRHVRYLSVLGTWYLLLQFLNPTPAQHSQVLEIHSLPLNLLRWQSKMPHGGESRYVGTRG